MGVMTRRFHLVYEPVPMARRLNRYIRTGRERVEVLAELVAIMLDTDRRRCLSLFIDLNKNGVVFMYVTSDNRLRDRENIAAVPRSAFIRSPLGRLLQSNRLRTHKRRTVSPCVSKRTRKSPTCNGTRVDLPRAT